MSSIKSKNPNRRGRRKNSPLNQPQRDTPIGITAATATGTVLTLTFDEAVYTTGMPTGITTDVAGATPVSAAAVSPNSVAITYSASVDAATALNIPFRDPAIRNSSGGFVTSNTFPLAA